MLHNDVLNIASDVWMYGVLYSVLANVERSVMSLHKMPSLLFYFRLSMMLPSFHMSGGMLVLRDVDLISPC